MLIFLHLSPGLQNDCTSGPSKKTEANNNAGFFLQLSPGQKNDCTSGPSKKAEANNNADFFSNYLQVKRTIVQVVLARKLEQIIMLIFSQLSPCQMNDCTSGPSKKA